MEPLSEDDIISKANRLKDLMETDDFKELILNDYIHQTSVEVGTNYTGDRSDVESLLAITHFKQYLDSASEYAR